MHTKKQRVIAWIGIILLVLLFVGTLICAFLDFEGSERLFAACLFASVGIPILIWIYIGLYGKITNKKTIADMFPEVEGLEEAKLAEEQEAIEKIRN